MLCVDFPQQVLVVRVGVHQVEVAVVVILLRTMKTSIASCRHPLPRQFYSAGLGTVYLGRV